MTKLVYRVAAIRDFDKIARDISKDNPSRAETFREDLITACENLTDFPLQCEAVPERGPNVRRQIHGNYLIFYRYDDKKDCVIVLRVVYGTRHLPKIKIS